MDRTEAAQPDGALDRALETARSLLARSGDAFALIDHELRVCEWNTRLEQLSGHARALMLGQPITRAFPDALRSVCMQPITAALHGNSQVLRGRSFALPETFSGPADPDHESIFLPLTAADGRIVACAAVAREQTTKDELYTRLIESEARFRTMADCAPVLLRVADTDARCSFFNQTWLSFRGRTFSEERGFGWAEGVHPEDVEECLDVYGAAFKARREFQMEYRLRRHDGEYRWILDHGVPRFSGKDHFLGYIGSCTDITAHRTAEDALRQTTERLTRSNTELERFAHAASHDLQEPLRMVINFSSLLAKKYDESLDDTGRQYIAFAVDGARRMKALIDGLLALASVKNISQTRFGVVDSADAVAQALANLQLLISETQAVIEVEALPPVRGHLTLLVQAFQNLIHNSLKFRRESPRIRIVASVETGIAHFRVQDNGIGMDMKYAERVFVVFQRLHARNEYPGSGIGLGLCKQVVEVHEGKIWLESVPGEGTTVHMTLPAA